MFAMLCANNVNRSTEAHDHLHAAGLRVCSFGAGNRVRFPGPSRDDPRIYEFSTPYATMHRELQRENGELCVRACRSMQSARGDIGACTCGGDSKRVVALVGAH